MQQFKKEKDMKIEGKMIIAGEGKKLHRIGSDAWFSRCTLLSGETEADFEEAEASEAEAGPEESPSFEEQFKAFARMQTRQRKDLSTAQALSMPDLVPEWSELVGTALEAGQVVRFGGWLWRVRQAHTAQKEWRPCLATASLWERIDKDHAGTMEDPIPYEPPMEIFAGKHYSQGGRVYRCTRDSGQALSHNLSELVGLYVEEAGHDA